MKHIKTTTQTENILPSMDDKDVVRYRLKLPSLGSCKVFSCITNSASIIVFVMCLHGTAFTSSAYSALHYSVDMSCACAVKKSQLVKGRQPQPCVKGDERLIHMRRKLLY